MSEKILQNPFKKQKYYILGRFAGVEKLVGVKFIATQTILSLNRFSWIGFVQLRLKLLN